MAFPDFKFGAKIKLFDEHEVNIRPNADRPMRIEYRDPKGIAVTKEFLAKKLNIQDGAVKDMIPESTRITDLVYDRGTTEFEIGIVINPGDDFILNRYKDIVEIEEITMIYSYNPNTGEATPEGTVEEAVEEAAEEIIDENLPEE
jgi:hypothetical protein